MRRLWLLLLMILIESCLANPSCGTKSKCKKLGAKSGVVSSCQPKTQECEGRQVTGKKYCKESKSCACCVSPKACPEDEGFFRSNGSSQCFKYFDNAKYSWEDAKAKCLSEGLVLARPSDQVAVALRNDILDTYGDNSYAWLDARTDGSVFRWTYDNTVLSSNNSLWSPLVNCYLLVNNNFCLLILAHHDRFYEFDRPYACEYCPLLSHALCELV